MSYLLENYDPAVQQQSTITTNKNLSVAGNVSITGTAQVSGVITLLSGVTSGVNTFANQYIGNFSPLTSTDGTDTTPVAGTVYYGLALLPTNSTITGVAYMVGSVGGTNSVIVSVYSPLSGALIASSALAGTTVGTAATMQRVPFTSPVSLPGTQVYYVGVQFNGTTARFRTVPFGDIPAASTAGTFGTLPSVALVSTFTANTCPIGAFY